MPRLSKYEEGTRRFAIRFPGKLLAAIQAEADARGITPSEEVIRRCLSPRIEGAPEGNILESTAGGREVPLEWESPAPHGSEEERLLRLPRAKPPERVLNTSERMRLLREKETS